MILGDLLINDQEGGPPLEIMEALALIAQYLHPTFDVIYRDGGYRDWASLDSCVLVSAVLRDFLFGVGFKDAEVRPVSCWIERRKGDEIVNQAVIGVPGVPGEHGRWNGHMVVVLPNTGWLLDGTLYQARRAHWQSLPGMVATPILDNTIDGRKVIAVITRKQEADVVQATWIDTPENNDWRTAPDIARVGKRKRLRREVTDTLIRFFEAQRPKPT